jgi:hypothetical protein
METPTPRVRDGQRQENGLPWSVSPETELVKTLLSVFVRTLFPFHVILCSPLVPDNFVWLLAIPEKPSSDMAAQEANAKDAVAKSFLFINWPPERSYRDISQYVKRGST